MKSILLGLLLAATAHAMPPGSLKVEHLAKPVGLDDANPRFSWQLTGDRPGLSQSAWQVLVATSSELLEPGKADLWDSGKTDSASTLVRYAGKPLPSSTPVYWRVRYWSGDQAMEWSAPQRYITGLIGSQPSEAWISFKDDRPFHKVAKKLDLPPARYYRKSFSVGKTITRRIHHLIL